MLIEGARPLEQAIEARIRNHKSKMKAKALEREYHGLALQMISNFEDAPNIHAMLDAERNYLNQLRSLLNDTEN